MNMNASTLIRRSLTRKIPLFEMFLYIVEDLFLLDGPQDEMTTFI